MIEARYQVGLALLLIYLVLKYLYRYGYLPEIVAKPWCFIHFFVWHKVLLVTYHFGHRRTPWKQITPHVWLGKTPLSYHVATFKKLGITHVLNLQYEYAGPLKEYKKHGIIQLRIPVVDHFEPTPEEIERGVQFIEDAIVKDTKVYVHCQGGHGRSAAIVYGLLAHLEPQKNLKDINVELSSKWKVRTGLYKQKSVIKFLNNRKAKSAKSE